MNTEKAATAKIANLIKKNNKNNNHKKTGKNYS